MSQENVEVVRRGFEHFLATGEQSWHSIDPNVEVHDHNSPDQATYRGHAGMARWLRDWSAAWETWSIEPERFIDAGDRVVAIYRMSVRGTGSGLELDREEALSSRISSVKRASLISPRFAAWCLLRSG